MSNVHQITALKAQKNQRRVNIYLDGEFAFGLNLETVYKFKLKNGLQLNKEQIDTLLLEGEYQTLLEKAVKFISLRPRSAKEIKDWLNKKQVGLLLRDRILQKLNTLDLVNDQKFVDWWIEQRTTFKPRGRKLLFQELLQKGVNRNLISQALTKLPNQTVQLKKLASKKLTTLSRFPFKDQKSKLVNYLLRKGYSYDLIKPVIDELMPSP